MTTNYFHCTDMTKQNISNINNTVVQFVDFKAVFTIGI